MLVLLFLIFSGTVSGQTHEVTVRAQGFQGRVGQCVGKLYTVDDDFGMKGTASQTVSAKIDANGKSVVHFREVLPGNYAVLVFHDEDMDGRVSTSFLGRPAEAIGTSNNIRGMPSFERSKFSVQGDVTLKINLNYF